MTQKVNKPFECKDCETCEHWKDECTFSGVCELCVDPKAVEQMDFLLYGDPEEY